MKNILAICGSTQAQSSNLDYIQAISHLCKDGISISVFSGLDQIPHFNPDLDNENPPEAVIKFRNQIKK